MSRKLAAKLSRDLSGNPHRSLSMDISSHTSCVASILRLRICTRLAFRIFGARRTECTVSCPHNNQDRSIRIRHLIVQFIENQESSQGASGCSRFTPSRWINGKNETTREMQRDAKARSGPADMLMHCTHRDTDPAAPGRSSCSGCLWGRDRNDTTSSERIW